MLLLALIAAAWAAFAALAEDVATDDPLVNTDQRFANWLHGHTSPTLTPFFRALTACGSPVVVSLLVVAAALFLWRRRQLAELGFVAVLFGGVAAIDLLLKALFHRARPVFVDPLAIESSYSFPSGHATLTAAVYGALAFLLARRLRTWPARLALTGAAVGWILLVGFSRLYLGLHFLSDVAAGFAVGLGWLFVCVLALSLYERPLSSRGLIRGRVREAR